MKKTLSSALLAASLGLSPVPSFAQDNIEGIISGVAKGLLTQELDRQAFAEAQRTGSVAAYQAYLQRFPGGVHAQDAERAIRRLGGAETGRDRVDPKPSPDVTGTSGAQSAEARLGLSRSERARVQSQLSALGYDAGVADGLWGRKTRQAIGSWQRANGFEASGYITNSQLNRLNEMAGSGSAGGGGRDTVSGSAQAEEQLLGLTRSERRDLQRRLTRLGYPTGGTDGVLGRNSRNAIASWQRDEGLEATGYITADQLRDLRVQTGN